MYAIALLVICSLLGASDGSSCRCWAHFDPVISSSGEVFFNGCVAECHGAVVTGKYATGTPAAATPSRRQLAASSNQWQLATESVILKHAEQGYRFIGFAKTSQFTPSLRAHDTNQHVSTAASRADSMAQLLQPGCVVRWDVKTGALYSSPVKKAPDTSAGITYAAQVPQQPSPNPVPVVDPSPSPVPVVDPSPSPVPVVDPSPSPKPGGNNLEDFPEIDVDISFGGKSPSPAPLQEPPPTQDDDSVEQQVPQPSPLLASQLPEQQEQSHASPAPDQQQQEQPPASPAPEQQQQEQQQEQPSPSPLPEQLPPQPVFDQQNLEEEPGVGVEIPGSPSASPDPINTLQSPLSGEEGQQRQPAEQLSSPEPLAGRKLLAGHKVAGQQQQLQQQWQQLGRKLHRVLDQDERVPVNSQPAFPVSAVGQLLTVNQNWRCTAALIAERTILTAAHCVYDRISGTFASGLYFIPSRYRGLDGEIRAPMGSARVEEIFILSNYVVGLPQYIWEEDLAVVKLKAGTTFGKVFGHLGAHFPARTTQQQQDGAAGSPPSVDAAYAPATKAWDPEQLAAATSADSAAAASQQLASMPERAAAAVSNNRAFSPSPAARPKRSPQPKRSPKPSRPPASQTWQDMGVLDTAGYPRDKGPGSLVTTSCQAQQLLGDHGAAAAVMKLQCSTSLGQSGSPLVDVDGNVKGVVSFEMAGADGYNGGCVLTAIKWATLVAPNLA